MKNQWGIYTINISQKTVQANAPMSLIWITVLFDVRFKCGDGPNVWGYVGTKGETLRVQFSNFVQWHVFVNYLTCM